MANYMKDPRDNMVSENGIFLDWCGDNVRYYYNGSYVDLCGMTPEEYMKRWCCGGGSGNTDEPTTSRKNAIVLSQESSATETGQPAILLTAKSVYPTASDVTLTVTYEYIDVNSNEVKTGKTNIIIPYGETKGTTTLSKVSITVTSATPTPKTDENFDYMVEGNISSVIGCLFHGIYAANGDNDGITVGLENIVKNVTYLSDNAYNVSVDIPYTYYDGKITDEVVENHTMDIVFALDADIKSFSITDPNGVSYDEFLSDVVKLISVEAPDGKGHLVTAFYKVYRLKSDQFVNVDNKPIGESVPFDIKIKIQ